MEDASGEAVAVVLSDMDFDLGFLDGLDLDFDLAEFCVGDDDGGGGSFLAAAVTKKGEVPAGLEFELDSGSPGDSGGGREGSPNSVVTDDGPLELRDRDGSMSAYVSELEMFLMMEDDDGGRTTEEVAADDEYFFVDLLADDDNGVAAAAGAGVDGATAEEEKDLATHEDEATSRKRAR